MTPKPVFADNRGIIGFHETLAAMGCEAGHYFPITAKDLIPLPPGSQLFMLPERSAVGYDRLSGLPMPVFGTCAVAAFLPPGYTATQVPAYMEETTPRPLPLYSYAAVAHYKGKPHVAAIRVDGDKRHDLSLMDPRRIRAGAKLVKRLFPKNRLVGQLERCAFGYGCANACNLFLSRYEAPLPVSPACNAACRGCISFQPSGKIRPAQPRIRFVPDPDELAQIALYHISRTKDPIVSFGQGCEGEPLTQARTALSAIKMIRRSTGKGVIHMNTNASKPKALDALYDAGLDSIRVSMNSVRPVYYTRYYKPRGYSFKDVARSIANAKRRGVFVSLNYLTMPGFTDSKDEFHALTHFLEDHKIDMIQWRNLNYDPAEYFRVLRCHPRGSEILGIRNIMHILRNRFPRLRHGYFNPAYSVMAY